MSYAYHSSFRQTLYISSYGSLSEAVLRAAADLYLGDSWPVTISGINGVELWKESGPLTTSKLLQEFAESNSIQWPDNFDREKTFY